MLPCHAVMVRFVVPVEADFDGAFVDHDALAWLARSASKPGRDDLPCWTLHSKAAWSESNLELPAERVAADLIAAFAEVVGRSLPAISFSGAHRWLYARTGQPMEARPVFDPERRLGVCGDWVRGDRVEDAFLSAEALADAIEPIRSAG